MSIYQPISFNDTQRLAEVPHPEDSGRVFMPKRIQSVKRVFVAAHLLGIYPDGAIARRRSPPVGYSLVSTCPRVLNLGQFALMGSRAAEEPCS